MQVKSIAECSGEHSAILSTYYIKLPFVIKIFVLSVFVWPFYTGLNDDIPSVISSALVYSKNFCFLHVIQQNVT